MRPIKNTTELIELKTLTSLFSLVFETDTHIEIHAKLGLPCTTMPTLPRKDD